MSYDMRRSWRLRSIAVLVGIGGTITALALPMSEWIAALVVALVTGGVTVALWRWAAAIDRRCTSPKVLAPRGSSVVVLDPDPIDWQRREGWID